MKTRFKIWQLKLASSNATGWRQEIVNVPLAEAFGILSEGFSLKSILLSIWSLRKSISASMFVIIAMSFSYWLGGSNYASDMMKKEADLMHTMGLLGQSKMAKESAEDKLNGILQSKEYKQFLVYKDASVLIPNDVDVKDIDKMLEMANEYDIPNYIYFRVIHTESHFVWAKNGKILSSSAGAQGYMQVIPSTFSAYCKRLDIPNKMTVENNLRVGAKLLSDLYEMYNPKGDRTDYKSWRKPLMAYNAGCGNVASGRAETFKETRNYVKKILNR